MKKQLITVGIATFLGFGAAWLMRDVSSAAAQYPQQGYQQPAYGAPAAARQFSQCFAVSTWYAQGRAINGGQLPNQMVRIPAGFTPVGGAAAVGGYPSIILCR